MKKSAQHLIAEVPQRQSQSATTIGIDLGDVWSHYCTLNQDGEVIDRGRFRTTPKGIEKWFTDVSHCRVAMEASDPATWSDKLSRDTSTAEGLNRPLLPKVSTNVSAVSRVGM